MHFEVFVGTFLMAVFWLFGFSSCAWALCLLLVSCFLFSNRLPGGGITFFAAAKKVIKESSFSTTHTARPV
jgi:hypothetical protein